MKKKDHNLKTFSSSERMSMKDSVENRFTNLSEEASNSSSVETPKAVSRRDVLKTGAAALAATALATNIAQAQEAAGGSASLAGQVALVTGAARGIGRATAEVLAREGADIIALDIADPNAMPELGYELGSLVDLEETRSLVEAQGRACLTVVADVRDSGAVSDAVSQGIGQFGQLDIVIANAGVDHPVSFTDMTDQQWQTMMDVNLTGSANTMRAALPHLQERGGRIVAVSSVFGRQGATGHAHYVTTKWGLIGLVKSLAIEAGPSNITVNAVAPTAINTPLGGYLSSAEAYEGFDAAMRGLHPLPVGILEPVEVAESIAFLTSPQAQYLTGIVLDVAAGYSAVYTA